MSRILLVEDDEAISELLCLNLEAAGHDVLTARDGVSGLRAARTGGPDVMLLDVMLPRMNGIDVCRKVRRSDPTPIIMLTAREERIAAALEAGADACLTKPFSMRDVLARISTVLEPCRPSEHGGGGLSARHHAPGGM
ncbi:MAG: response regulator [Candidatus Dormibacteraeota bacterium]|nr:response regulator [Candidatus Dormibacteraeota bacterium]